MYKYIYVCLCVCIHIMHTYIYICIIYIYIIHFSLALGMFNDSGDTCAPSAAHHRVSSSHTAHWLIAPTSPSMFLTMFSTIQDRSVRTQIVFRVLENRQATSLWTPVTNSGKGASSTPCCSPSDIRRARQSQKTWRSVGGNVNCQATNEGVTGPKLEPCLQQHRPFPNHQHHQHHPYCLHVLCPGCKSLPTCACEVWMSRWPLEHATHKLGSSAIAPCTESRDASWASDQRPGYLYLVHLLLGK